MGWTALRTHAEGPLGRLSVFFAVLPFVIGLFNALLDAATRIEKGLERAETRLWDSAELVSAYWTPVLDWVAANRATFLSFYVGIGLFILGRVIVSVAAPARVSRDEALRDAELALSLSREHVSRGRRTMAETYLSEADRLFAFLRGGPVPYRIDRDALRDLDEPARIDAYREAERRDLEERRFLADDQSREGARQATTILFVAAYVLIFAPVVLRFFWILTAEFVPALFFG